MNDNTHNASTGSVNSGLIEKAVSSMMNELEATAGQTAHDFSRVACAAIAKVGKVVAAGTEARINAQLITSALEARERLVSQLDAMGQNPVLVPYIRNELQRFDATIVETMNTNVDEAVLKAVVSVAPQPQLLRDETADYQVCLERRVGGRIAEKHYVRPGENHVNGSQAESVS